MREKNRGLMGRDGEEKTEPKDKMSSETFPHGVTDCHWDEDREQLVILGYGGALEMIRPGWSLPPQVNHRNLI